MRILIGDPPGTVGTGSYTVVMSGRRDVPPNVPIWEPIPHIPSPEERRKPAVAPVSTPASTPPPHTEADRRDTPPEPVVATTPVDTSAKTIQDVLDQYQRYLWDQPYAPPYASPELHVRHVTIRKRHTEIDPRGKRIAEKQMLAKALQDAQGDNRRLIDLRMSWTDDHELTGRARFTGRFPDGTSTPEKEELS